MIFPHHIQPKAKLSPFLGFCICSLVLISFTGKFLTFPVFRPRHQIYFLLSTYWKESFDRYLSYWLHIHIKRTVGISGKASYKYNKLAPNCFSHLITSICWIWVLWNSKLVSILCSSIVFIRIKVAASPFPELHKQIPRNWLVFPLVYGPTVLH